MTARFTIVGLGEALFDMFPERQVLGGAPLNVAVHAHQLGAAVGGRGVVVSRVGQDDLGNHVLDELRRREMTVEYVQTDPDHDTGKVYVNFDDKGEPDYEIVENVAWDWIQFDPDTESLANRCDAVCFGSLAQREAQSRNTIYRFLEGAKRAVRLFDVNLRQDFYSAQTLTRSCEMASVVKLNQDELPNVARLMRVGQSPPPQPKAADSTQAADAAANALVEPLIKRFSLQAVALTRGKRGTVLYTADGGRHEGEPVSYQRDDNADSVGAGDACSAGLVVGMVLRWPAARTVSLANHIGAYVASQPGATPALPDAILDLVRK